jgi:hypothetical protein
VATVAAARVHRTRGWQAPLPGDGYRLADGLVSNAQLCATKVSGLAALAYEAALGSLLYSLQIQLRGQKDGFEHRHFLDKLLPTAKKGDELFSFPSRSKGLPDFFKGRVAATMLPF